MQFKFSFQTNADGTPNLSLEQMTAFETAGRIWSTYLKDDVTVNVHVGMSDELPDNVIGGALPGIKASYKLDQLAQDLAADASSQDDQTVADNLANKDNLHIWTSPVVNLTTATAKSLDIMPDDSGSHFYSAYYSDSRTSTVSIEQTVTTDYGGETLTTSSSSGQSDALDGVIFMSNLDNLERNQDDITSNDVSWSYPGSPASLSANRLDFLSVALHELGHILGFVSGADDSSWLLEQITQLQSQALATERANFSQQITTLLDNYDLNARSSLDSYTFEPTSTFDLSSLTTLDLNTLSSTSFDIDSLEPIVTSDSSSTTQLSSIDPNTGDISSSSSSFGFDSLTADSGLTTQLSTFDLDSLSSTEDTKGIDLSTFNLDFDLSTINYDLNLDPDTSISSSSVQESLGSTTTNSTTVYSTSFTSEAGETVNSTNVYSTSYTTTPTTVVDFTSVDSTNVDSTNTAPESAPLVDSSTVLANSTTEEDPLDSSSTASFDDMFTVTYADLNTLIWQDPYVLEALGLTSLEGSTEALGTDESSSSDWASLLERVDADQLYTFYTSEEDVLQNASLASPMSLDLFRYSADSAALGINDIFGGGTKYFSIDGGQTTLAEFATGKDDEVLGGDGYQASHWKHDDGITGIMVPALSLDSANAISTLDLRAFDVLGWNLADSLLGTDGIVSDSELQQTLDLSNPQTILDIWNEAESFVQDNQATLVGDRADDIFQMIESSEIYEGKKRRSTSSSTWQELWQEILDVFSQEASFSSFSESTTDASESIDGFNSLDTTNPLNPSNAIDSSNTLESSESLSPSNSLNSSTNLEPPNVLSASNPPLSRNNVIGGKRADDLRGKGDRDKLIGKQGQDVLKGNDGDDLLKGGHHQDILVGGSGADIFIVQNKKDFDVARDFTDGEDLLKLSGDITFEQLGIIQDGHHTLLQKGDDLLMVLRNVDAHVITSADFR